MGNKTETTVTSLLSTAPRMAPMDEPTRPRRTADVPATGPGGEDLDDTDLEAFDLPAGGPLVKPRRRRPVTYQTVRINRPTAQVLRAQWLIARRADPLLSYVEFATIVTQRGLQALADERRRAT